MGTTTSNQQLQFSTSQLPINYKLLNTKQHPILGEIKHILNNNDSRQYSLIERVFVSQTEYEKCLLKIKSRAKLTKLKQKYLPNQYILQIIDYRTIQQSEFCGKTYKLFIFLKHYQSTLKQSFQQRISLNQPYQQTQLVQLMLKIINCLIQMYDHSLKPYHLSMESILLFSKKVKLIDCDLTSQMSPIDMLNFRSQLMKGTYIAPQLLTSYLEYQSNTSKSDIFTLGIIILSLINLKPLDEIYDYNKRKIDFTHIEILIEKTNNISQGFKSCLREMVQENTDQRIGILRLKQTLCALLQKGENNRRIMNDNKLQDSGSNNNGTLMNGSKGLIYLGKQPTTKHNHTLSNASNSFTSTNQQHSFTTNSQQPIQHQRKNSYHKLLSDKSLINREKKSISYNNNLPDHYGMPLLLNQQHHKSTIKMRYNNNNYKQTPKTNIQLTPPTSSNMDKRKQNINRNNDISDIRSDTPISPSTLQPSTTINPLFYYPKQSPSQLNNLSNNYQYQRNLYHQHQQHYIKPPLDICQYETVSYKLPITSNNNKDQFGNVQIQNMKKNTINTNKQDFNTWIKKQQNKLISYQSKLQSQLSSNLHLPTFSKLTSIDKLQTPRITKNIQFNNNNSNNKPSTKTKTKQQTPIKSLQLIRTQKRQQHSNNMKKQVQMIEQEKVFGRYDFSNGSVYEGEFNSDNQFQGNGTLYFSSGKVFYSGCWKKNQFHGFGILNNIQTTTNSIKNFPTLHQQINYHNFNLNDNNLWTQYEGEFYQDKKHGFGTLYFINGDKFSGCFFNDSIQGFGNFYKAKNHQTITGIWMDNLFKQS